MDTNQTVSAQFDLLPVTLTVTKSGRGDGTVTSDPPGINCGGTCEFSFTAGTVVTLTATPDILSVFVDWKGSGCSGNGTCTITMDGNKKVEAQFDSLLIIGRNGFHSQEFQSDAARS